MSTVAFGVPKRLPVLLGFDLKDSKHSLSSLKACCSDRGNTTDGVFLLSWTGDHFIFLAFNLISSFVGELVLACYAAKVAHVMRQTILMTGFDKILKFTALAQQMQQL